MKKKREGLLNLSIMLLDKEHRHSSFIILLILNAVSRMNKTTLSYWNPCAEVCSACRRKQVPGVASGNRGHFCSEPWTPITSYVRKTSSASLRVGDGGKKKRHWAENAHRISSFSRYQHNNNRQITILHKKEHKFYLICCYPKQTKKCLNGYNRTLNIHKQKLQS